MKFPQYLSFSVLNSTHLVSLILNNGKKNMVLKIGFQYFLQLHLPNIMIFELPFDLIN